MPINFAQNTESHARHGSGVSGHGEPLRILAIDVGAGTQDILVYESDRTPENCLKLVVPSQTHIAARAIRAVTVAAAPLHLAGGAMGGGASAEAVSAHIAAGLRVTANPDAARTLHNDLERVRRMGVLIRETAPGDATVVQLADVDLAALRGVLSTFAVEMPEIVAVAVQDHGFRPGAGNNAVRFEYLQSLIDRGGDLADAVFLDPPLEMTRMQAVAAAIPGVYLMDTGAAAVLGAMGDRRVAVAVADRGAILINVGNMHTFATLVKGRRLFGLFEHHTGGITAEILSDLVGRLRAGTIDNATFTRDFDGHGAALDAAYRQEGPFEFVTVTGPNRRVACGLVFHEAAPHGDMMLSGSFGLVEGVLLAMERTGRPTGLSLVAGSSANAS
ncbi:MAG: DUF1786 domain-containing protein [Thermomicrobiales bacterium]